MISINKNVIDFVTLNVVGLKSRIALIQFQVFICS